jgi:hypothetical protein
MEKTLLFVVIIKVHIVGVKIEIEIRISLFRSKKVFY